MNRKGKLLIMLSQIVMILAFFAGMWLNYFKLMPVIDIGETSRMTTELGRYFSNYIPNNGGDISDLSKLDSLEKLDPYGSGDILIMDSKGWILYSNCSQSGNGYDYIEGKYGEMATRLLVKERESPSGIGRMDYVSSSHLSLYSRYIRTRNVLIFYAVDYYNAAGELIKIFKYLLIFMSGGGLILMLLGYFIYNRISRQAGKEAVVQRELEMASRIQKAMLPSGEMSLLQLDINARLVPAKKVGGDFYSYILKDGLLYFCIGDVSGKGVPAALFMGKAVTLFRSYANSGLCASDIANRMNNDLCLNNDWNMFMTCIIGVMQTDNGHISYVDAGHEQPVIWNGREDSKAEFLVSRGSVPLGVIPETGYEENEFTLQENGLMLLYTDGVSEARNKDKKLLGKNALLSYVESSKDLPGSRINDMLLQNLSTYESKVEQSDDITLLTFRRKNQPKHISIRNNISELKTIVPFIKEILNECRFDSKVGILVRSGLDEAVTNCVRYAYGDKEGVIDLEAGINEGRLCFTLTDSGMPFNPLGYKPDTDNTNLKVGGLGISIFRKNFDEVTYERLDSNNILKLYKKL